MKNIEEKLNQIKALNKVEYQSVVLLSDLINKSIEKVIKEGLSSKHNSFKEFYADIKIEILSNPLSKQILFYLVNTPNFLKSAHKIKEIYNFDLLKIHKNDMYKTSIKDIINKPIPLSSIESNIGTKFLLKTDKIQKVKINSSLKELGYSSKAEKLLKAIASIKNGSVIVTGSTGSGKSILQSALLEEHLKKNKTIENPIEIDIPGINIKDKKIDNLINKKPDVLSFTDVVSTKELESILNKDSFIKFADFHAINGETFFKRLDMENVNYENEIKRVITNKLINKLCDCKKEYKESGKILFKRNLYGCSKCEDLKPGLKGKIPIIEIYEGKKKIYSFEENIKTLLENGTIDIKEAQSVIMGDMLHKIINIEEKSFTETAQETLDFLLNKLEEKKLTKEEFLDISKERFKQGSFKKLGHAREALAKELGFSCYRSFLKSL